MFIHLYKNNKIRLLFLFLTGMTEKLEELLRELIKRGREPRGEKYSHLNCDPKRKHRHIMLVGDDIPVFSYSLRQLVSLESWLWQFCMENGLLNSPDQYPNKDFRAKNPRPYWEISLRRDCYYKTEVYQYRLIESALIPEEELGQFLVDNIKIQW